MANVTGDSIKGAIRRNVSRDARIMTDSFASYRGLGKEFASHEYVEPQRRRVRPWRGSHEHR